MTDTYYDLMRRQGITRRSFLKFCSLTAASLGLGEVGAQQIAQAMQTKQRTDTPTEHDPRPRFARFKPGRDTAPPQTPPPEVGSGDGAWNVGRAA